MLGPPVQRRRNPWYPTQTTDDHPIRAPESFNDAAAVNGKAWPNLNVDRGLYRFRLLNG